MPKETKGDSSPYLKCPNLGFRNAEARTSLGRELPVAPTLKLEAAALKLLALTTTATLMRSAILRIPQEHVTSAVGCGNEYDGLVLLKIMIYHVQQKNGDNKSENLT